MTDDAQITVVIAAKNVETFLGETIASVRAQTLQNWAMRLIIDDSTDRSAAVAAAAAAGDRRISVTEGRFGGVSAARNAGLAGCRSPFVLFLDGDDLLLPDALDRFVAALERPERPVAAVAGHSKIDEDGRPILGEDAAARPSFPERDGLRALLARNIIVNGGTIAMRTDLARAVGGFDETLRLGEDWELWCRLALEGPFVALGAAPALLYRQRRRSAVARERGSLRAPNVAAIDRIFANPKLGQRFTADELRRLRRNALIDMHWATARAALYRGERLRFLGLAALGLTRYPDSLARGYLLSFALRRLTDGRRA
jgi:glycosyltransferase involved in cell wall biosynthesis